MTDDEIRALTVSPYKLTRNIANAALEARANLRFVIDERDRTFALMLARADTAEADLAAARAELATVKAERDESRTYALALVQEMKDRAQKEARETKLANAYIERLQSLVNKKDAETDSTQAALAHLLHDLEELAANSEGVAGLHMNGEVADWESLFPGGTFGAWLAGVEVARAALQPTQEPKP